MTEKKSQGLEGHAQELEGTVGQGKHSTTSSEVHARCKDKRRTNLSSLGRMAQEETVEMTERKHGLSGA